MKYWPSAGDCVPLAGSTGGGNAHAHRPADDFGGDESGAANDRSAARSPATARPALSPATAIMQPASVNSAGGAASGVQAQTITATAAGHRSRAVAAARRPAAEQRGGQQWQRRCGSSANITRQNSASTAPKAEIQPDHRRSPARSGSNISLHEIGRRAPIIEAPRTAPAPAR
jgi:hypothetical protein